MKDTTKRLIAGGASIFAIATIMTASVASTASAHSNRPGDWWLRNHGLQLDPGRIQAYFNLDTALHEHPGLGLDALKAAAFNTPDLQAAKDALAANSKAIAQSVDTLFPGTEGSFLALWNKHIGYYEDYLNAAKAGDSTGKAQAVQNLASFAKDTSQLLHGMMLTMNKNKNHDNTMNMGMSDLEQQLTTHTNQTIAAIDHLVSGNYSEMYTNAHDAYNHMEMIARSIAGVWFTGNPRHMSWDN